MFPFPVSAFICYAGDLAFCEKIVINVQQIDMHHLTLEMKELHFVTGTPRKPDSSSYWEGFYSI